jgi:hypothetical protein
MMGRTGEAHRKVHNRVPRERSNDSREIQVLAQISNELRVTCVQWTSGGSTAAAAGHVQILDMKLVTIELGGRLVSGCYGSKKTFQLGATHVPFLAHRGAAQSDGYFEFSKSEC